MSNISSNMASTSEVKDYTSGGDIEVLIKKELDEAELKNNLNQKHKSKTQEESRDIKEDDYKVEIDVKIEASTSNSVEEIVTKCEQKNYSPEMAEESSGDSDVEKTSNSVEIAKRRLRHDSIEIKEEVIYDEDLEQVLSNADKEGESNKRQQSPEVGGGDVKKKRTSMSQNIEMRRQRAGEYHRLCAELSRNVEKYYEYFHMSHESFEELHNKLSSTISKTYSSNKTPISSRERLVICLRYLALGESYGTLAGMFQLGRSTISKIVHETCREIWNLFQPQYMPAPTRQIWEESEKGFSKIWKFPNCVGCIDGKHITVKYTPPKKPEDKNQSLVFLSVIDPWCKFTIIDVGHHGSPNELGLFERTKFYQTYIESLRKVVPSKPLPGTTRVTPHVFIGDETFTLQPFVLRPFPFTAIRLDEPKKKFNERLSKPRTVVTKTFDMLLKNWKIFSRPIDTDFETAKSVIKAVCCLHNYILKHGRVEEEYQNLPEESQSKRKGKRFMRKQTFITHKPSNQRWTAMAASIREIFVSYCSK